YRIPVRSQPDAGPVRGAQFGRDVGGEPFGYRRQRRMLEIALHRSPDAGDHREVARLAVAPPQPREDADDLGVALRAEAGVVGLEVLIGPGLRQVTVEHRALELGRHV